MADPTVKLGELAAADDVVPLGWFDPTLVVAMAPSGRTTQRR